MAKLRRAITTAPQPVRGETLVVTEDLITRFIAHTRAAPDKIAIITSQQSLTYQQLYQDVLYWKSLLNQYTHSRVLICLDRSPQLFALFLATQWLDISYIPVDPSIPIERLRAIIADSQPQLLIYDINTHPHFKELPCTLFNVVERLSSPRSLLEDSLENYVPTPSGIAYIIYTSGSTGKPKGVAIPRHALHNLLTSMSQCWLQEEHDLALAITTVSFDMSIIEIYLPFWQKKSVFIANQAQHKDPLSLAEILNNYPITFIQATPSVWNMLLNLEWTSQHNLVAVCGGEPLTQPLAQRILEKASALWNMYGPTEATVWCASKKIIPDTPITIGRPIHNIEMRVMDEEQQILAPYAKGELYIGGIGLADEYINNPELTSKKFVSCQNALLNRLYQVGDLACTTEEGEFIIFGRTDNQIKLHGYRIELEEIEAQIQAFPGIQEGAVTVHHEQLIAYISWLSEEAFSKPKFIQHLAEYLPEYMVPKNVTLLKQLPKTVSGKIDRKALPLPVITTSLTANTSELSSTQLSLTRIWTEELSHNTIGINDNFFELGGHSLLAARIITKIAQQLGKKTHLQDIYRAPTIKQFAKIVEQAPVTEATAPIVVQNQGNSLPLHDFQLLMWLFRLGGPKLQVSNMVWRKRLQGTIDKEALDLALQWVLQKQEIFSYHIHLLYPLQTPCAHPNKQFRHWCSTSLRDLPEAEVEPYLAQHYDELVYKKTWRAKSLWISADLFYLPNDQIEFQVCMSHMIADESCHDLFFQSLSHAYLFFTKRTQAHTDHTLQPYKNYISHHHTILRQQAAPTASFWANYLQDAGSFHFPKQYILSNTDASSTQIALPESFVEKLRQFCAQHCVAINDALCAAVSLALLQCCDNDLRCAPHKMVIFTTKSTRDDPEYDHAIGCFLRLDPIKLELNQESTLVSLSKQAQLSANIGAPFQQASSLVKLAAIGKLQLCLSRNPIKRFVINKAFAILSKYFPELKLDQSLFNACEIIAILDQTKQFLMNINMPQDFLEDLKPKVQPTLFGIPEAPIPHHPFRNPLVKYMLDINFHRSSDQNTRYIVLTSNLRPDFQRRLGETVSSLIEHCL
ncbi:MAG: amino acid adenylation domain-containing protein [Gammaproteobacteria bacterium]